MTYYLVDNTILHVIH